jgi:hypothetical protein
VAIALSVLGLISASLVTKTILANRAIRSQATKNNISAVSIALASFVANNNRLPRPALDNSGHEFPESEAQLSNFVGRIPHYTLGIPLKTTLDGDGKPLIYIVEQVLTSNFPSIYGNGMESCFCDGCTSSICIDKIPTLKWNPIAFVIDTADNPPAISEKIRVIVSQNTYWIPRDMLLMQYLKSGPCRKEKTAAAADATGNPQGYFDPFNCI